MPSLLSAAIADPEVSPWATLLFLSFFGASLIVWASLIQRLIQRRPLIAFTPRRPVPWNWIWALGALLIYIASTIAALGIVRSVMGVQLTATAPENPGDVVVLLASTAVAGAFSTGLTVLILAIYCGATRSDLGLDTRWLGNDVLYGIAGFLAVTPVVFFIKWLLLPFSDENHPLEKLAREHPTPAVLFWTITVAVIIAPWVEEFLLRVVFQGWLERCFFGGWTPLDTSPEREEPTTPPVWSPASDSAGSGEPTNPYAPPRSPLSAPFGPSDGVDVPEPELVPPTALHAALPIVISSAVFAALHIGHGIDPIPLFVLALVLGWLYQRTHRLWPSVALHTALNATSVALLFLAT